MNARAQRWELLPALVLGAVTGWLTYSRLDLWASAREGVSALLSVPPGPFWLVAAALGAPLFLLAVFGAALQLRAWTVRLFYVFGALLLSVQVFVLPPVYLPPPVTADLTVMSVLEVVATRIHARADPGGLPDRPEALDGVLEGLPPPPYRVAGQPVGRWRLELRRDCEGPVEEAGEAPVATIFYCVSADRQEAFLTFVGTGGEVVGAPAIGRDRSGRPLVLRLEARPGEGD